MVNIARGVVAFILALAVPVSVLAGQKFSFDSTPGQLSKDVVPEHYAISITPDMKGLTFKGSETIDVNVRKAGRAIVLNSVGLSVARAGLVAEPGQTAEISTDTEKQTITLTFPRTVGAGRHKLQLNFEGKLSE